MPNKLEVANYTENKEKEGLLKTLMKRLVNPVVAFFTKKTEKYEFETDKRLERLAETRNSFINRLRAIMPTLALGDPELSQQQVRSEDVILTEKKTGGTINCTYKLLNGEMSFSVTAEGKEYWTWLQNKTETPFKAYSGYSLVKKVLAAQSPSRSETGEKRMDIKVDQDRIEVVLGKNYREESKHSKKPGWSSEASLGTKINAAKMAYEIIHRWQKGLPIPGIIIFSTGPTAGPKTRGDIPTESELMLKIFQEILIEALPQEVYKHLFSRKGAIKVFLENKSLTTLSNASETHKILESLGVPKNNEDSKDKSKEYIVGLNTLEFHLKRCELMFDDLCKALVEGSPTDVKILAYLKGFRSQLNETRKELVAMRFPIKNLSTLESIFPYKISLANDLLELMNEIDLQIKTVEDYRNSPDVKIRESTLERGLQIAYRLNKPFGIYLGVYDFLEKRAMKKLRNS